VQVVFAYDPADATASQFVLTKRPLNGYSVVVVITSYHSDLK